MYYKERFARRLYDDALNTATLLVSELVTNGVLHGQGKITLRALLDEGRLVVVVIDDHASSRWGVRNGTAQVWFEPERPGPGADGIAALAPPSRPMNAAASTNVAGWTRLTLGLAVA